MPEAYGGLEYEILGKPFPDVVTIQTSRGKRNIYVASSTGAKIVKKWSTILQFIDYY